MAEIHTSVLVPYAAAKMFALVDGVEEYPQFLPWCGGAELKYRDEHITSATLHINYRGIKQSFTTENVKSPPQLMEIRLIEGPFKALSGTWRFLQIGEQGCKIELDMRYEFASRLLEMLIGPVFSYITHSLVDAFVKRAQKMYG